MVDAENVNTRRTERERERKRKTILLKREYPEYRLGFLISQVR